MQAEPIVFYHLKEKVRLLSFLATQAFQLNNQEFSEKCISKCNAIIRETSGYDRETLEWIASCAEDTAMEPFRVEKV